MNIPSPVDPHRGERGVSMVFTLLSLTMVTLVGLTLATIGMSTLSMAVAESETNEALAVADAGIEHAKQLVLYQDWPDLNVFLQRGNGTACDFDELADVPNMPPAMLPAGYPPAGSGAANFIPVTSRTFGQGRYFVQLCDNHTEELAKVAPFWDDQENVDVDKVIYARSVGFGPRGSRAAVELTLGAAAMPAVVVNGNLEVKGNPIVTGPAGSIHANGELELSGNPCTYVYYSSVVDVEASGNVQGGYACTAAGVDSRPYSPPIRIPKYDPLTVAQWAVQEGRQVIHLRSNGTAVWFGTTTAVPPPAGWSYSSAGSNVRWNLNAKTTEAILYIDANVSIGGNVELAGLPPFAPSQPVPLTLLVAGSITATGTPEMVPALTNVPPAPLFTNTPLKYVGPVLLMAGHDLSLGADFDSTYQGLFYARHQIDVAGSPTLNGQLVALNEADTGYPVNNNSTIMNPIQLQGGVMVISGSPTVNYGGNGLQTVKALTWRECRGNWAGTTFNAAGQVLLPGTPCGTPP